MTECYVLLRGYLDYEVTVAFRGEESFTEDLLAFYGARQIDGRRQTGSQPERQAQRGRHVSQRDICAAQA